MSAPAFFQNAWGKADIRCYPRFHDLPFGLNSRPYPQSKKYNPRFGFMPHI